MLHSRQHGNTAPHITGINSHTEHTRAPANSHTHIHNHTHSSSVAGHTASSTRFSGAGPPYPAHDIPLPKMTTHTHTHTHTQTCTSGPRLRHTPTGSKTRQQRLVANTPPHELTRRSRLTDLGGFLRPFPRTVLHGVPHTHTRQAPGVLLGWHHSGLPGLPDKALTPGPRAVGCQPGHLTGERQSHQALTLSPTRSQTQHAWLYWAHRPVTYVTQNTRVSTVTVTRRDSQDPPHVVSHITDTHSHHSLHTQHTRTHTGTSAKAALCKTDCGTEGKAQAPSQRMCLWHWFRVIRRHQARAGMET